MSEIDFEADKLGDYTHWKLYLHESQRYLGRSYISLAREGDIDPFTDTTNDERAEFLTIVTGLKTVLSEAIPTHALKPQ